MHLPTPAVLLTVVYAAAVAVAVTSAATGQAQAALAGLVVLSALAVRGVLRRSRRTAPSTLAAIATVDATLAEPLADPAPAIRAA